MPGRIVDASEIKQRPRKSPATRLIEQLHAEGYLTQGDLAEKFGVNIETIRRLGRQVKEDGSKRFKGPTKAARSGDLVVWGYTPADVAEIGEYFGEPIETKPARKAPAKKKATATRKGK